MCLEATKPSIPAQATPQPVSIRRILLEWSHADDTPFTPDDVDRILDVAFRNVVRRY